MSASIPRRSIRFQLKSGTVVRAAITLLILVYLGLKLDWADLRNQFLKSDPLWLLAACLLFGATFLLAGFRWWILLKVQEIMLPLRFVTAVTFVGQFFNSFLPGAIGGDVVRVFYVLKYSPHNKTRATLSVIVDRAMGLAVVLCSAIIGLAWQFNAWDHHEDIKIIGSVLLMLMGLFVAGLAVLALVPFRRLPAFFHKVWQKIPRHHIGELVVGGIRQHGRSLRLTLDAMAFSVGVQFLVFTAGYCIARAIHLDVTYGQMVVVLAVVTGIVSLPISIGGHGVREGAFIVMFAAFGIISIDQQTGTGREPAILFSVLFFALLSVWSLVGGVVYLMFPDADGRTGHLPHLSR